MYRLAIIGDTIKELLALVRLLSIVIWTYPLICFVHVVNLLMASALSTCYQLIIIWGMIIVSIAGLTFSWIYIIGKDVQNEWIWSEFSQY